MAGWSCSALGEQPGLLSKGNLEKKSRDHKKYLGAFCGGKCLVSTFWSGIYRIRAFARLCGLNVQWDTVPACIEHGRQIEMNVHSGRTEEGTLNSLGAQRGWIGCQRARNVLWASLVPPQSLDIDMNPRDSSKLFLKLVAFLAHTTSCLKESRLKLGLL